MFTAKTTELIIGLALTGFLIAIILLGFIFNNDAVIENFTDIKNFGLGLSISSSLLLVIFFFKRILFLWQHPLTVELKTFFKLPSHKKTRTGVRNT